MKSLMGGGEGDDGGASSTGSDSDDGPAFLG
jgi:hypothetical protein